MLTQKLFLFFLSMVPIIELRGAIPLGMAWGIPMWQTYLICVIGNILPVPILVVFARRVLFGALPGPRWDTSSRRSSTSATARSASWAAMNCWGSISLWRSPCPAPAPGPAASSHPAADEAPSGLLCHLPGRSYQRHHHVAGLQRRIRIPVPVRLIRHHRLNSFLALPGNLLSANKNPPAEPGVFHMTGIALCCWPRVTSYRYDLTPAWSLLLATRERVV